MLLKQLLECLCDFSNNIDANLLNSSVTSIIPHQPNGATVHLTNHQQVTLPNANYQEAKQIYQLDYQAVSIFNQATLSYFRDQNLNDIINYLSKQLSCVIYLVNADSSVLTATSHLLQQIIFPDYDFHPLMTELTKQPVPNNHFSVTKHRESVINIHWVTHDTSIIGATYFITRKQSDPNHQLLINLVASYFNLMNLQQNTIFPAKSKQVNHLNYSPSLELALAERTINSPVTRSDLTSFFSRHDKKFLFVVGINRSVNEIFMRNLVMTLNQDFMDGIYSYLGTDIIILANLATPLQKHTDFLHKLHQLVDQNHLVIGISDPLTSVTDLFDAYHQANLAKNSQNTGLIEYSDTVPQYLAQSLQRQHQSGIINPLVTELIQYDQRHHSEYFKTLRTCLLADFNITTASKRLSIHHNTVLYRLKKIHQILHYAFDDPQKNASILLSVILAQYMIEE